MTTFLLTILICFILYLALSFFLIYKKLQTITKVQDAIDFMLMKRFKFIELLISKMDNKNNYEETPLYEITQLRVQAQKFRAENDKRSEYFCESQISKLLNILINNIREFKALDYINDKNDDIQNIIDADKQINELINKFNKLVSRYNKSKSGILGSFFSIIYPKLNDDIEIWLK